MPLSDYGARPVLGYENKTVSSAAVSLTRATYEPQTGPSASAVYMAQVAFITVEDNQVRYSVDPSTTPTAGSNGHEVNAGDTIELHGAQIRNFQVIATGSDAVLRVTYFG